MRTILFYINAIHDGGAERVILQIAKHFALYGNRVILVTSFVDKNFEYPVPKMVERLSIEQEEIRQGKFARNFSRIMALRAICKREKPDVLVSFMCEPNFRALLATIGLPVKNIVSVRNDPNKEYRGKVGRFVGKYIMPMADGCVFQTEDAKAWFCKDLQNRSVIIPNAVKEEFFVTQRTPIKHRIVNCGRLSAQKNHKLLIEAFAKIADKILDAELHIYGEGVLHDTLQKLINELNLTNRVFLKGQSSNVPVVLSKADVFVLSSDYEGMPNALMEALAVGVPCISTDCPCGGPKMLIKNGRNGFLVPVGNAKVMADAMERMLGDSELRKNLGVVAKESAERFKSEVIFKEWEEYLEMVVNDRKFRV